MAASLFIKIIPRSRLSWNANLSDAVPYLSVQAFVEHHRFDLSYDTAGNCTRIDWDSDPGNGIYHPHNTMYTCY